MATRICPYCEAENPEDEKYCKTCGIPQASDAVGASVPPPPQRRSDHSHDRLLSPAVRYAAGALVLVVVAFTAGRLTSGSPSDEETAKSPQSAVSTTVTTAPSTTQPATTITTTTTTVPIGFDDVGPDTPYSDEISALTDLGVREGCNPPANTLFCPNDLMTRAQMASLLVAAMGYTDGGSSDLFIDDDGTPFEADIQKVAIAGITKGCNPPDNDRFCPDDPVSRGQVATFLVRALGLSESTEDNLFTDDDGSVYEAAIQNLATAGILTGCNPPANTEVCPLDNITRGEMAALLVKALRQ